MEFVFGILGCMLYWFWYSKCKQLLDEMQIQSKEELRCLTIFVALRFKNFSTSIR